MVAAGAPNLPIGDIFPLIAMFAVANSALINMMMASRLLYGMAKQGVLPPVLGRVLEGRRTPWVAILFTTVIARGLLIFVGRSAKPQPTQPARRHDGVAVARGVHRRQHLLPGAAPGPRREQALPGANAVADHRGALLRLPGRAPGCRWPILPFLCWMSGCTRCRRAWSVSCMWPVPGRGTGMWAGPG